MQAKADNRTSFAFKASYLHQIHHNLAIGCHHQIVPTTTIKIKVYIRTNKIKNKYHIMLCIYIYTQLDTYHQLYIYIYRGLGSNVNSILVVNLRTAKIASCSNIHSEYHALFKMNKA